MAHVLALVPARDEADRIGATVTALRGIEAVDEVVVIEAGSTDRTAWEAHRAGARVWRAPGLQGKGDALDLGLDRVGSADVYLLADADLAESASGLAPVLAEVLAGRADLAIAVLPRESGGGFGLVKHAAGAAIRLLSGFAPVEPLSGQRAVSAACLQACRPLASGFGLETAMTIDAVRARFRVLEVPADVHHRTTARDLRGFVHRGRQGWDIIQAVIPRVWR